MKSCNRKTGAWSQKKVICALSVDDAGALNQVIDNAFQAPWGDWGGTCVCPDGQEYQAADNNDACGSLACDGGTMQSCNRNPGAWSRKKVICSIPAGFKMKEQFKVTIDQGLDGERQIKIKAVSEMTERERFEQARNGCDSDDGEVSTELATDVLEKLAQNLGYTLTPNR